MFLFLTSGPFLFFLSYVERVLLLILVLQRASQKLKNLKLRLLKRSFHALDLLQQHKSGALTYEGALDDIHVVAAK